MNKTIQLYIDEENDIKGYPITSFDRVINEHGNNLQEELDKNTIKFDIVGESIEVPPINGGSSYDDTVIKNKIEAIKTEIEEAREEENNLGAKLRKFNEQLDNNNNKISYINVLVNNINLDIESLRIKNDTDDDVFKKAITILNNKGGKILLSKDKYNLTKPLVLKPSTGYNDYAPNVKYKIYSNNKTIVNYSGNETFLTLGSLEWGRENLSQGYIDVELENIRFRNLETYVNGIDVLNVRKIKFKNIEVRGFRKGIHTLNVWNSSSMEEVIIWNSDKSNGGVGLHIDKATNNITYRNCAVIGMNTGILISATDEITKIGHIYTNLLQNFDIEFCKIGVLIDPKNCNVANINLTTCHFENNDYHLVTYHTNTIWNLQIDTCYFLNGDINIATKTDFNETSEKFGQSQIIGGQFTNNFICNGKVRINRDEEIVMKGFENYNNSYYGETAHGNSALVSNNLRSFQSELTQKRYSNQPITPTRYDDIGDIGDIRFDSNNLYVRTQSRWCVIPLSKINILEKNMKNKITGTINVPNVSLDSWGNKDIKLTVEGVNVDSGLVIKLNPRK